MEHFNACNFIIRGRYNNRRVRNFSDYDDFCELSFVAQQLLAA
jgi:hypothetical protein